MVAGPAAVAVVAACLYWALKQLGKLPTVQVVLMFVVGCGLTALVGSWVVTAFGWGASAASGLPKDWRQALLFIPAGLLAAGALFVVFALHPKQRPHQKAAHFALAVPLVGLLVAGGLGANTHTIVKKTNDTSTQMVAKLGHPKGGK